MKTELTMIPRLVTCGNGRLYTKRRKMGGGSWEDDQFCGVKKNLSSFSWA